MTTYPDDADGAVLADLAAQGVDMSQPLLIEFPVAVPDEASANKTLKAMTKAGYDSHIEYDEGEPDEDGRNRSGRPRVWSVVDGLRKRPNGPGVQ